ncbi:MAG: hypothetical protein PVH54_06100, partial [Gammaproteobacteria bacterium]
MPQRIVPARLKILSAVILALQLFGCIDHSGNNDSTSVSPQTVISGSVGDGPIVGATLNIYDKDGNLIQTETSDGSAGYSARIKARGNAYPLTIEAINGTDLVTGRAPDFRLASVVTNPSVKQVNITPFTTLIVESARSMTSGLNEQSIADVKTAIIDQLNFGLDPALIADPIGTEIDDDNVVNVVKASETLGEMIRRARDTLLLTGTVSNADEVVRALADDISDGILDGLGGDHANSRITAVATIVAAQVLIESLSNSLRVDGSIATEVLDNALLTTRPTAAGSGLTANVTVNSEMLEQARATVAAARALAPITELETIADILDVIQSGSLPSEIDPVLPGDSSQDLDQVIALTTTATDLQLAVVTDALYLAQSDHGGDPVSGTGTTPALTLTATPGSITQGSSTRLSWSSTDATSCSASGGWLGTKATTGAQILTNLTSNQTYTLTCSGAGGSVAKSVSVAVTTPFVSFNGKPDWAGIWGIGGGEGYSNANRPWYKGTVLSVNWRDIEPADNSFDFSPLDQKIQQAVANGLYVMPMVYHGHLSPQWIYNAGVTPVLTQNGATYPYYLDPDFMYHVSRMINMVAEHMQSLPKAQRDRIIGLQAPQGTIGDPMPYLTDPVDPQYDIASTDWQAYEKEIFAVYANAYSGTNPPIVPLFKVSRANEAWLQATYPLSWRKTNLVAQMYQLNAEMNSGKVALRDLLFGSEGNIRARGEFGNAVEKPAGWFTEAPVWNVYWNCLWMLTYGLDIFAQRPVLIESYQPHVEAFTFFTKHAGNKVPGQSRGAWIALRDGLDVSDKNRFPEAEYGQYSSGTNPDRYAAIAAEFSAYGAMQGDPAHQADQALTAVKQTQALNDVGNKIWTDNYGVYLRQIDPLGTSQGYWRVGSTDQPYGRFARSFQHASGKDRMDFDIDDRFFDNQP